MFGLGIFIGILLGVPFGILVMALCVASKDSKADKGVENEE